MIQIVYAHSVHKLGVHPEIFMGGWRADPEAKYSLLDFKNYVIKIMS
jgi:hypothetical protein